MAAISTWSSTASNNNSVAPDGFPEGMAPSGVNDSAREVMAAVRTQWEQAEWFDWGDSVTRTSATTFTIAADVTSRYTANRRLRALGSSTTYHTIQSSSYSAPDTTVTVTGSLPATLSSVELGILDPANQALPTALALTSLVIQDSGGTDTLTLAHNGTNATTAFANTTAWQILDGISFRVYDATDTDYIALSHDGTNGILQTNAGSTVLRGANDATIIQNAAGTQSLTFTPSTNKVIDSNDGALVLRALGAGEVFQVYTDTAGTTGERLRLSDGVAYLLNGPNFRVYDSTNADYIQLSHDGTDANIGFAGTTRLNINGAVSIPSDSNSLRLGAGEDVDVLFDGTTFRVRTVVGTETMMYATPNLGAGFYYNGAPALEAASNGATITGPSGVNSRLTFNAFGAVENAYIQTSNSGLIISQERAGGSVTVQADDVGSVSNTLFFGDPDNTTYIRGDSQVQMQVGNGGTVVFEGNSTGIGFFAATPVAQPTVTGSRGGNAALASVLTALANLGLIVNNSTV